eukprot:TRINITY_DN635_c0_g1_i1.p2 TRINITY_DN635_c0_g1~~TRINITY_DN635_c0_g1_i1.p2  ORF type:complete len:259 (-),score=86.00 TRINITY_DN635_c0_g1_i1:343-1119(-)
MPSDKVVWKPAATDADATSSSDAAKRRGSAVVLDAETFSVPPITAAEQLKDLLPRQLQVYLLQRVVEILAGRDGAQLDVAEVNKHVLATFGKGKENSSALKAAISSAGGWRSMCAARPSLFDWSGLPPTVALKPGLTAEDVAAKLTDPTFIDNVESKPPQRRPRGDSKSASDGSPGRRKSLGSKSESGESGSSTTTPEILGADPNPGYRRKTFSSPIALSRQPRGPDGPKGFSVEYQTARHAGLQARHDSSAEPTPNP